MLGQSEKPMTSPAKKNIVQYVVDAIKNNANFAIVKFEKTKHTALEDLRKELQKASSQVKVIKNSLLTKALQKLSSSDTVLQDFKKHILPLKENSAVVLFSNQWDSGLSAFYKFAKNDKTLFFKVGILEKQIYDAKQLETIAQLPGKDVLAGKIISSLKSPSGTFVYALKYNMQKFAYILSQKSKQI